MAMRPATRTTLMAAFTALALAGCLLAYRHFNPPAPEEKYRVARIDRGDIVKTVSANGTLVPVVLVNVGTQVSGTIARINADYNDRVRQGQVLAELDPALIKAQLAQSQASVANARASLKLAEANEKRSQELYRQDYIPKAELDQALQVVESARAQLALAQAQVRRDQTNLGYSVITSPVSGVVVSRNVDVGQTVAASFQTPTLFSIAQDLKKMQIDTTVAEADVGSIRVGQAARFSVDAFPDRSFQGAVRQIRLNAQVLQNVVTYNVVIDVPNLDESLLPGMTAFVNIAVAERRDVPRLPLAALRFRPPGSEKPEPEAGKTVYLDQDGRATAARVQLGLADGRYGEILGGTPQEGQQVILEDLSQAKTDSRTQPPSSFRLRAF